MFGTLFIFGGLTFASYTHTIDALIRNYQIIAHFQLFTSTNQEFFLKIVHKFTPWSRYGSISLSN
jgi:hypothetical protein